MTDTTHEAPERIWAWGWRADSVWQEQTWQHEDEPMSTMEYVRFDLMETAEQQGYANAMEAERKLHEDRIEALTKEREQWRRAAETRAEGWKISDDARIEAEAKLTKVVEALQWCSGSADFNEGGVAREGWLKVCAPLLEGEIP